MRTFWLSLLLATASSAMAQEPVQITGRFVRLVPPGAIEVVERVNNITKICPADGKTNAKLCREEKLAPRGYDLDLYSAPSFDAGTGGKITIVAKPGLGLHALYQAKGARPVELVPDRFDADWTRGPLFDFAIKSTKGDWIELPKGVFPSAVWINPTKDWDLAPTYVAGKSPKRSQSGTLSL